MFQFLLLCRFKRKNYNDMIESDSFNMKIDIVQRKTMLSPPQPDIDGSIDWYST